MKTGILTATLVAMSLGIGATASAQMNMSHDDHGTTAHAMKLMVEGAWARASVGRNGAAFLTVVNTGETDDRLIAAKSDVSPRVELHTSIMDGNIMKMRHLDAIPVPSGKTVTLKPGGMHMMIIGLKKKLVEGQSFPLTLVFEKAGEVTVNVPIKGIGAMGGGMNMGHGGTMNMDHGGSMNMDHGGSMGGMKH